MSSITNIVELQDFLLEKLDLVEQGKLSTEALKGFNGTAGQLIKSALTQTMMSKQFNRPVFDKTLDFMLDKKQVKRLK
jgi:hypothetical protein